MPKIKTKESMYQKHIDTLNYVVSRLEELNKKFNNDLVLEIWWFGSSESGKNNSHSDTDIAVIFNKKYYNENFYYQINAIKNELKELGDFNYKYTNVDLVSKYLECGKSLIDECKDRFWQNVIKGTKIK